MSQLRKHTFRALTPHYGTGCRLADEGIDMAREVNGMTAMTIGEASRKADVGVETIRFYERRGLIKQPRKPADASFRVYPDETVQRIRFIRQARELGFSLCEIDELLSLRSDRSSDGADVHERSQAKLREVNRKLEQLQCIRAALEELIAACPGQGPLRRYSIIEAFVGASGETGETTGPARKESRS